MAGKKRFEFEEKLCANGKTLEQWAKKSIVLGLLFSLTAIAIGYTINTGNLYIIILCFAVFFSTIILSYFLELYFFEKDKRAKEALVPDLLLQASAFPRGTPVNKILGFFAHADFGLLGREFELALLETQKGVSLARALENIKKRCKSRILDRAMTLLARGYESGADLSSVFRASAEDFFETNSLSRERNAALIVEKYTLLFAGGLIVPVILGLLVGMVAGIDFSGLEELEFGLENAERQGLLETIVFANQIYIVEYALIASFFLASQEGNSKKALLYAMFLLPVSFGVNFLAKAMVFF